MCLETIMGLFEPIERGRSSRGTSIKDIRQVSAAGGIAYML